MHKWGRDDAKRHTWGDSRNDIGNWQAGFLKSGSYKFEFFIVI